MARVLTDTISMHAPLAELERALIDDYIRTHGYDPSAVAELSLPDRRTLLTEASVYASGRLSEVELKWHLLEHVRH